MRALLTVSAAACALAGSGTVPGDAGAYQSFFTPLFAQPNADPCAGQGIPYSGGIVVRRQPAQQPNDVPRSIALLCSPAYSMPFGTLLADDAIWQLWMHGSGPARRHMLEGGKTSVPWKQGVTTKDHPAFKGPGGNAPGWKDLLAIDDNFRRVQVVVGTILGADVTAAAATFCLGGLTAFPVTAVPCVVGAAVVAVTAGLIAAPQLINLIGRYFQRGEAMNNGNWFAWSEGAGFWNGFGDVDQSWINPSLTSLGDSARMRVGVVFSNVLLGQGPDFDLSRQGGSAAGTRARRLLRLAEDLERSRGRTTTGTGRSERLFGGRRNDYVFGGGGADRLFGRRGDDVILQGARGNDRVLGGRGDDNIDGHRGRDVVSGGPGNDQIVDFFGDTTVYTGRGHDLVAVRDGHGGDTVVCRGAGRKRILADPGDLIVGKLSGGARTIGARACPAGSRVITGGPLPRQGRGY